MSYKYMSKQELCNAIYETVMTSPEPLTRLEIAQAIGKKKARGQCISVRRHNFSGKAAARQGLYGVNTSWSTGGRYQYNPNL